MNVEGNEKYRAFKWVAHEEESKILRSVRWTINFMKTWELHRAATNAATPNFIHTKWRCGQKVEKNRPNAMNSALRFSKFSLTFAAPTIWSLSSLAHHNTYLLGRKVCPLSAHKMTQAIYFPFIFFQQKMMQLLFLLLHNAILGRLLALLISCDPHLPCISSSSSSEDERKKMIVCFWIAILHVYVFVDEWQTISRW